jgi:transposase-like protein
MREVDFTEKNLRNRWLGVNSIWRMIQGRTKVFLKGRLEQALRQEAGRQVGCRRYSRSLGRHNYRNGSYCRDLLTIYDWIESLEVPRVRESGLESQILERYRRRQGQVDRVLLESFLLGHATRKTGLVFRSLFGASVSAQTVSNIAYELAGEDFFRSAC